MSVWTLRQIDQAGGIRAEAEVDRDLIARAHDDMLEGTRRELFGVMKRIALPFAIELHPEDVRVSEVDDDAHPFTVKVRAWWEPRVRTIELRGGRKDGERMEYASAPQPVRILAPLPPLMTMSDLDDGPVALTDTAEMYACVGWHEQERVWVYEAA